LMRISPGRNSLLVRGRLAMLACTPPTTLPEPPFKISASGFTRLTAVLAPLPDEDRANGLGAPTALFAINSLARSTADMLAFAAAGAPPEAPAAPLDPRGADAPDGPVPPTDVWRCNRKFWTRSRSDDVWRCFGVVAIADPALPIMDAALPPGLFPAAPPPGVVAKWASDAAADVALVEMFSGPSPALFAYAEPFAPPAPS
jgi:hypothetical protein